MTELPISKELAEKLMQFAQQQNRPLEEILASIIDTDQLKRLEDDPRYRAAEKRVLPKIYARARAYWESVGDLSRLSLTDAELDEQFWCIDPDGIPRLKSDRDKISLPPDILDLALNKQWQRWQENKQVDDVGTNDGDTSAILNEELPDYLLRRMDRDNDGQ
jgi:hypothetical protein